MATPSCREPCAKAAHAQISADEIATRVRSGIMEMCPRCANRDCPQPRDRAHRLKASHTFTLDARGTLVAARGKPACRVVASLLKAEELMNVRYSVELVGYAAAPSHAVCSENIALLAPHPARLCNAYIQPHPGGPSLRTRGIRVKPAARRPIPVGD